MAVNEYPVIQMDPALAADFFDSEVMFNLYDALTYPTSDGDVKSHIATDYTSSDGKDWTLTIRKGVKFHDGTELTPEDVVFSVERMLKINQGYSGFFKSIESVEAQSDKVIIHQKEVNVILPNTLALLMIVNKKLVMQNLKTPGDYGDLGDYGSTWLQSHDAGSGPYTAVEYKPNEGLTTARFTDYWMGWENWSANSVPIDKGIFREQEDPAALKTMLANHEHDYTDWYQTDEFYASAANIPGVEVLEMPTGAIYTFWINTARAPTDDIHFRKAILWAFDYKSLTESTRGAKQQQGPMPSVMVGHDPNVFVYTQDIEKAKAELAQSKYAGQTADLELWYTVGNPIEEKFALLMQQDLEPLGINVKVTAAQWPQFAQAVAKADSTPNVSCFMFTASYPSPDFFLYYMYYPATTGGVYAGHWYADQDLGALIDQSRATVDKVARTDLYKQIQTKIMDDALAFYTVEIPTLHAMQSYIVGPKENYVGIGPELNMRNFQIDLTKKAQVLSNP
jgi:peptide/nickel transport system substrate-binding protein